MAETLRAKLDNLFCRMTKGQTGEPKDPSQFTEQQLSEIAGEGMGNSGLYSVQTVCDAFIRSGFSPEFAEQQARARVIDLS